MKIDEFMKDVVVTWSCQEPGCPEPGTYFCWHCKRRICEAHTRSRRMPFAAHPVGYCVACDAAIENKILHG